MVKTEANIHVDHLAIRVKIGWWFKSSSLHQDIPHGFDVPISIISSRYCLVSTRVRVVRSSCSTKPDSGVTGPAVVFIAPKDTYSCCSQRVRVRRKCPLNVKALLIALALQGCFRPNQWLPCVATQCGVAILSVSYEEVEGISHLVYDDKICFFMAMNLHTETNLGEWRVPVGL